VIGLAGGLRGGRSPAGRRSDGDLRREELLGTGADGTAADVLVMTDVHKRYGATVALAGASLRVAGGSIHGLIGQNGAGKSTLLKILAGAETPDEGTIELDGEPIRLTSPADAHHHGIGIVYQDFSLLANLTVAENISLGREETKRRAIDTAASEEVARRALGMLMVGDIPLASLVGDLTQAQRQLVEIAKVLTLQGSRILVFDEPTAALSADDAARLFRAIRSVAAEGVAVVFVSHRYGEVLELCDSVTVLRNGQVVHDGGTDGMTVDRLVELTLGQRVESVFTRAPSGTDEGRIHVAVDGLRTPGLTSALTVSVVRGEIVALYGSMGSGHAELARVVCGDTRSEAGEIRIGGAHVSTGRSVRRGRIGIVPDNRMDNALFPELKVRSNVSVAAVWKTRFGRFVPILSARRERDQVTGVAAKVQVATSVLGRAVRVLSGGNQQKVVLARWLMRDADVLLLVEPTQGVDVGARIDIYREIDGLARAGVACLLVSSDTQEVEAIADRALVFFKGEVVADLRGDAINDRNLLAASQGALMGGAV
jgi:ABC-type sugar transport system ATPase subunit